MLTNVRLTNFKCFQELNLRCTELNLLCGLNGVGKSSVIQSLLVLRQSFESGDLLHGRLVLGGPRIDLGTGLDVLHEDADVDEMGFALVNTDAGTPWQVMFGCSGGSDLLTASQVGLADGEPSYVSLDWQALPPFGGNMVYVNAERLGPRKIYPSSDVLATRGDFGQSSEQVWNILDRYGDALLRPNDARVGPSGRRRILHVVDDWLQYISPGAHVQLEAVADADAIIAGFTFDRPGDVSSRKHRATNVGFGLSYVMPVVLALLGSSGTLCLIENPESHLHPQGQTKLAELAALAAAAGVQVFVETHSDHFMDGVRIAVRQGILSPEKTSFHYFEREATKAVVTSPAIDDDGRLSRWPKGFFDQREVNLLKLL